MKIVWNKGLTKENSLSVKKISETMRARRIDNFKSWRDGMKMAGIIKAEYKPFVRNGDLAELLGMVLGDGHLSSFPRSERLRIVLNSSNAGSVSRYANLVEKVFYKRPSVKKRPTSNAVDISVYERYISKRLGIPALPKRDLVFKIPNWILGRKPLILRYLRGLYEAEGSYSVHLSTYTHKMIFSNQNLSLLKNVNELLSILGFHPHTSTHQVQLSRRDEVEKFIKLIRFREY